MSGIFIKILNMSISAGFVALVVVLVRLLIKKAQFLRTGGFRGQFVL